jgi:hypothetical protein
LSSADCENTLLVIQANNQVLASFDRDTSTYYENGVSKEDDETLGNWVRWRYNTGPIGDSTYILWPDTPALTNRYMIDKDGKLKVFWDENESTYIKLEF